ncbi:MAG: GNAT family N-acetyltransferase [Dehalococcoidia bacterium]
MKDDERLLRADANYAASMRVMTGLGAGTECRDLRGLFLAATGRPVAWLNMALIVRPLPEPEAQLREACAFYDERGLPFIVRVRGGLDPASEVAAAALGMPYSDTVPGMILEPIGRVPAAPEGVEVRVVGDEEELRAWDGVVRQSFGLPAEFEGFFGPWLVGVPDTRLYLAYVDGEVAATSMLMATDRVAGVYCVATLDAYRRRGLGEAMTWRAMGDGAEMGCLFGYLQASEMGKPVYERMGFREVIDYRTFVRPASKS